MMTNNLKTNPWARRCLGGHPGRRGSAIVLVLVTIVLSAVLATTLIQITRFERIAKGESNINPVIESVINEILIQAAADLVDENDRYLNTDLAAAGGGDEPWDFPWTNASVVGEREPLDKDGNPVLNVLGGQMDDTWLASHMPDFGPAPAANTAYAGGAAGGTNGTWRKITSLTGLSLGGNAAGHADLSLSATPFEIPVSNLAVPANSDTNIPTNSTLLVDADGDGIGDSRWEWAPLRQIGGTEYAMAVRIIDLSARMDVNVATGRFDITAVSASRGDSPAELNGHEFASDAAVGAGTTAPVATEEWRQVLNFHLSGTAPNPPDLILSIQGTDYDGNIATPAPGVGTRRDQWTRGASRVSNTFSRHGETPGGGYNYDSSATFGFADAQELLQANGINSAASPLIEQLMPTFLREGDAENTFATSPASITNNDGNVWDQEDFWKLDPRKHLSVYTGSAATARPAATGQLRKLKLDVNRAVATGNTAAVRTRIADFLTDANGAALVALYPQHLNADQLANQLTANIFDYIDNDNQLTEIGTAPNAAMGFEALPYITEIYTQRYYALTNVVAPIPPSTDNSATWTNVDNDQGYVIEIGNPFAPDTSGRGRSVSLKNIWIDMNGTAAPLTTYIGPLTELAPGEVLLLHRNSGGPLNVLSTYHSANANNTAGTFSTVHTAQGPIMDATAGTQTIGLQAEIKGAVGTNAGWNYSACTIQLGGPSVTKDAAANALPIPAPANHFSYIQTHYAGHGVGLRMMTVTKGGGSNDYTKDVDTLDDPSINCNTAGGGVALQSLTTTLANETKTGAPAGFANLDNQQIVWPDSERQRMHWVGDILQIPLIGPKYISATLGNETMAASFVAAAGGTTLSNPTTGTGIDALLLPYKAGTTTVNATAGAGTLNYPHALLLLERFTTFNPATDGEDGDGQGDSAAESLTDGTEDEDELLVPGKLNLNTAPYDTLVRLLPFPDLATREAVADAIVTRRESTAQLGVYGTGANGIPGIAYTTALYEQVEALAVNPSKVAGDTHELPTPGGTRIDFNDYETTLGTYGLADGIVDDREEEIMLAKWLTEVADTRSDVFVAYIVVQGYATDAFSDGPVESARLLVAFSRANVKETGDKAELIGRFDIQ